MVTLREKMLLNGIWYALGASKNDTVVIKEERDMATYFFSSNGGKSFYLKNEGKGDQRITLRVKLPAGGLSSFKSIEEVKFFGQSPAQRNCVELKKLIAKIEE